MHVYLDEGELLAHALVHAGTEAQVGEGLLLLLSLGPEPVRVELLLTVPFASAWARAEAKHNTQDFQPQEEQGAGRNTLKTDIRNTKKNESKNIV